MWPAFWKSVWTQPSSLKEKHRPMNLNFKNTLILFNMIKFTYLSISMLKMLRVWFPNLRKVYSGLFVNESRYPGIFRLKLLKTLDARSVTLNKFYKSIQLPQPKSMSTQVWSDREVVVTAQLNLNMSWSLT